MKLTDWWRRRVSRHAEMDRKMDAVMRELRPLADQLTARAREMKERGDDDGLPRP